MLRKPALAVITVSLVLVVFCVAINTDSLLPLAYIIFGISPFLLIWLTYTVIRFGVYDGKELEENEEWGYQDKNKDELSVL
jgi:hypothetical protein